MKKHVSEIGKIVVQPTLSWGAMDKVWLLKLEITLPELVTHNRGDEPTALLRAQLELLKKAIPDKIAAELSTYADKKVHLQALLKGEEVKPDLASAAS